MLLFSLSCSAFLKLDFSNNAGGTAEIPQIPAGKGEQSGRKDRPFSLYKSLSGKRASRCAGERAASDGRPFGGKAPEAFRRKKKAGCVGTKTAQIVQKIHPKRLASGQGACRRKTQEKNCTPRKYKNLTICIKTLNKFRALKKNRQIVKKLLTTANQGTKVLAISTKCSERDMIRGSRLSESRRLCEAAANAPRTLTRQQPR